MEPIGVFDSELREFRGETGDGFLIIHEIRMLALNRKEFHLGVVICGW